MKATLSIPTQDAARAQYIGGLLQNALNVVAEKDLVRLLEKVHQQPSIVKNALKFI